MPSQPSVETTCINTLRTLSIDAVQKANSGHPGLPLGAAPMAYVLWDRHLRFDGKTPDWIDRDRFVLSAGHGSMLLYSLLHVYGYELSLEDLKQFRQWESKTPGHPEVHYAPGVETTTGPLGQGCSNAVGMAIAERALAARFNRPGHNVIDHMTYSLVGDGDLMEGVSAEAASLAGHLRLGKLVFLYDANDICLDGPTSMTFTEDVGARFAAYGWHVSTVADGNRDLAAIDKAISAAKAETNRPSLIIIKTTIGFGSPNKAGTSHAHGSPLGPDEVKKTKEALGWPPDAQFLVPPEAKEHFATTAKARAAARAAWDERFVAYRKEHPALADELVAAMRGELPRGWDEDLPTFPVDKPLATRVAGGKVLNALAARLPLLIGGDADLSVSTKTAIDKAASFDGQTGAGRNIHYGVREHAMGAAANGIAYHGGMRPYTATFFTFSDYMRPAIRLAAMNHLPVTFVFTHDSVGLGEDGPTHQPVEHLMALRCIPGLHVVRPADANETREAWIYAQRRGKGPTALVLSRQDLPVVDRGTLGAAAGLHKGAYVLYQPKGNAAAIIIATGSEVPLALAAAQKLEKAGTAVRVVSMPCWEAFAAQDAAYQESVLPAAVEARVAVEAGIKLGWDRWIGRRGAALTIDRYGASAPAEVIFEKLGFTVDGVVAAVRSTLG